MIICGIDEAGRGPLAGPLAVAGCILTKQVKGLNDSKKLTEKQRERLFEEIVSASKYHITLFDAKEIDSNGLSSCIKSGLLQIKSALSADKYIFDGNSKFGVSEIETMIKADTQVQEVMAASILAKVTRDKIMMELDLLYPAYGFAAHKGYGTAAHIEAIGTHGLSAAHRESFKPKKLQPTLF